MGKKLSDQTLSRMRAMDDAGVPRVEIAKEFNVSNAAVTRRLGVKRKRKGETADSPVPDVRSEAAPQ